MIKSALVAMTIVGCDCDAKLCEYVGETPAQWTSMADCEAAMKSRVLREGNHDYPLVTGICRTTVFADPRLASTSVPSEPQPVVEASLLSGAVANGRSVLYRTANGYALVRDGLGNAAEATLTAAKRSTAWVAENLPAGF
ncbi:hypothetical protein [Aminobacter sp. HY435]|uniref:hypothetical protein n=1 Tax=Aminobacter sp. HY435 TaxID=2970917 RepID=UPI0022B97535|nr:hypothetical protein [Aminobacter sp. HY435]